MKQHILIIALMATSAAIQAEPADTLRPAAGEKQFVMSLGTNTSSFLIKKYKTASFAWRYGLSGNYGGNRQSTTAKSTSSPSYPYSETEFIFHNLDLGLYLNVGFQKSFGTYKNFEPYTGMDFGIGNRIEKRSNENKYTTVDPATAPGSQIGQKTETKSYLNLGTNLTPFIGFNYYLAERFALGAEYRFNLLSISIPGNRESTTTTYLYQTDPAVVTNLYKSKGANLNGNFNGYAQLTVTMFIGKTRR